MQTKTFSNSMSFKDFLFKEKRNRLILFIAFGLIIIQFCIFKYFYPFASYIHGDSFSYIDAANKNFSINTYPIGYSKLLRLISVFHRSDSLLVWFQYLFIQSASLFFLFTLFYFYNPRKGIQQVLCGFMILNPLFLHLANLVSSDGAFLAISFVWFALLVWIIHKPSLLVYFIHAVIVLIAFTFRYNAIIYPLISIIPFLISTESQKRNKFIGIALYVSFCLLFIISTGNKYKTLTGKWQFSPFSGWQLANNAMYAYRYVDSANRKPVPIRFRSLDNMIRIYFDTTRDVRKFPAETLKASTVYMWSPRLSLFKYRDSLFRSDTSATEFEKWSSMGPLFKEYGTFLIRQYPKEFLMHFLWPNANKYFAPPVEYLAEYNSGNDHVALEAMYWFNYRSDRVRIRMESKKVFVLDFYPILSGIINILMLTTLISFLILKGRRNNNSITPGVLLGSSFWVLNACFTIAASSVALRFQAFPILLSTTFALLQLDWMLELMQESEISALRTSRGEMPA